MGFYVEAKNKTSALTKAKKTAKLYKITDIRVAKTRHKELFYAYSNRGEWVTHFDK